MCDKCVQICKNITKLLREEGSNVTIWSASPDFDGPEQRIDVSLKFGNIGEFYFGNSVNEALQAAVDDMEKSEWRGHPVQIKDQVATFVDTGEPTVGSNRPCGHCQLADTPEGHDGCLGTIPNAVNACCGHGLPQDAYIQFLGGTEVRGLAAIGAQESFRVHRLGVYRRVAEALDNAVASGYIFEGVPSESVARDVQMYDSGLESAYPKDVLDGVIRYTKGYGGKYQCREIGEGDWVNCSKDRYEYCSQSPQHDTRARGPCPGAECDEHEFIWVDTSTDHEYGRHPGGHWECSACGEPAEDRDPPEPEPGDLK